MSKKKPPKQPAKDFHTSPFDRLRGLRVQEPSPPAPKPPPAVKAPPPAAPRPREDVDDLALFLREMADVARLSAPAVAKKGEKGPKPEEPLRTLVRRIAEEERLLFLEAVRGVDLRFSEEEQTLRPAARNRMRELRRGRIRINLELDLHGLTREEALEALSRFVSGSWKRQQEAVLVITGKGNNSEDEPVLQPAVAGWLREKGKQMVAEFVPAPRSLGGSGAFVVFLKEHP